MRLLPPIAALLLLAPAANATTSLWDGPLQPDGPLRVAQAPSGSGDATAPPRAMPPPAAPMPPPEPASVPGQPSAAGPPAVVEVEDDIEPERPADLSFGVAAGMRWVTIPSFVLDIFTQENVPLSSWGTALQVFRRKGNFDVIASFTYQRMSPRDGNWLGNDQPAAEETDYVQFRGFNMYGLDVSFVWHTMFTEWFGIHYGAGIGVGFLRGDILRTSNFGCTEENAGDVTMCHPLGVDCSSGVCNEQQLDALNNPVPDNPAMPSRFGLSDVPLVVPIVNAQLGLTFRVPQIRGWEAKVQGGFYNAFVLGGAVGYTF